MDSCIGSAFGCPVINVLPYPGAPASGSEQPTSMNASFTPTDANGAVTLAAAATACGFTGFDWQQTVTLNPGGVYAEDDPTVNLWTLNVGPYLDPPPSSYTYNFTCLYPNNLPGCDNSGLRNEWLSMYMKHFANANPFYYSPLDLGPAYDSSQDLGCAVGYRPPAMGCQLPVSDADTLNFFDKPGNPTSSPAADCFAFTTQLVGLCGAPLGPCGAPLYQWTWKSNYSGGTPGLGGVFDVNVVSDTFPSVPGSGTGGVTITSINGVPLSGTTPPVIVP